MPIAYKNMKTPLKMVNGYIKPKTYGYCTILDKNRIILIAAMFSLFAFGALVSNEVQGFTQYVKINIKNAYYSLDGARILLTNYDTGDSKYVPIADSTTSSSVYITSYMPGTNNGDELQACLFTTNSRMACDYRDAYYTSNYVNFYIDYDEAEPVR
jgi:hypothetical protein